MLHSHQPILAMCSYCQRVRFPPDSKNETGIWVSGEEYYTRGGDSSVSLSHTLCPDCLKLTFPSGA